MVQEVTTRSWGGRIVGALWGVLFGIALICAAFYVVFWNEGHALHTAQALDQTHKLLLPVAPSPINEKNNMRVIYVSGLATTDDRLTDQLFNVSEKAIQLNRKVIMFQWREEKSTKTEKKMGGSEQEITTYSYKKVWSPSLIDSSNFKESGHQNPSTIAVKSKIQYAHHVTVGDYILPDNLIEQISGGRTVSLDEVSLEALKEKFNKPVHHLDEDLYVGDNPGDAKIGDIKISMIMVPPQTVSIIAQQVGKTLQPFMSSVGQGVSLIDMGSISADQMIHKAKEQNKILCWMLRAASLIMMIIGFALIMQPVVVLADVVPFFGSLVGFGTGLVAFVLGLACWAIAVAIAWFVVRPMLSLGLLGVTVVIIYFLLRRKKNKLQNE